MQNQRTITLAEVLAVAEGLWPKSGAESWDNTGLVLGDLNQQIDSILLAVDATSDIADQAAAGNFDLLLTHHPLLFRGVTSLVEQGYHGAIATKLIRANCALLAVHTNADSVATGTSMVIAHGLGLRDVQVLQPSTNSSSPGIGSSGELKPACTLAEFVDLVSDLIPITAGGIRVSGDKDQLVKSVAICAGAGDSFLANPLVRSADVYLTSDLRHHPALENNELAKQGLAPALVDISHWAAESLWLNQAAKELEKALPGIQIAISKTNTDPWDFLVIKHES